jgi:hypothetical protein
VKQDLLEFKVLLVQMVEMEQTELMVLLDLKVQLVYLVLRELTEQTELMAQLVHKDYLA